MQQFSRKKEKKKKINRERDRAVVLSAGDSLLALLFSAVHMTLVKMYLYIFRLVKMYLYLFLGENVLVHFRSY